jgi:hypothetical protein
MDSHWGATAKSSSTLFMRQSRSAAACVNIKIQYAILFKDVYVQQKCITRVSCFLVQCGHAWTLDYMSGWTGGCSCLWHSWWMQQQSGQRRCVQQEHMQAVHKQQCQAMPDVRRCVAKEPAAHAHHSAAGRPHKSSLNVSIW